MERCTNFCSACKALTGRDLTIPATNSMIVGNSNPLIGCPPLIKTTEVSHLLSFPLAQICLVVLTMGIFLSKTMDDNLKKQQEFMLSVQQLQMERQLAMQNEIRERQMAFTIARSRDFFWYWITFDAVISTVLIAGAVRNKRWNMLITLVPLNFLAAYHWDNAYGPKLNRIRGMADQILDEQNYLLELPHGLPTFASIEAARLEQKNSASLKYGNEIFL